MITIIVPLRPRKKRIQLSNPGLLRNRVEKQPSVALRVTQPSTDGRRAKAVLLGKEPKIEDQTL
jgi:hypothetical protein